MGSVVPFPAFSPADAAIGARIRLWRDKRGLDQGQLANLLHLSVNEIRLVESGRRHLDSAEVHAATRALRLPIWALVSDYSAY